MPQQMLHLDRDVISQIGKLRVQRLDDRQRVARPVQEIRVAERDVLGPGIHLLPDVGQHDLARHDAEPPLVDRHDRAVPAQVLAAAAGLGITRHLAVAAAHHPRIPVQRGQCRPVRACGTADGPE